MSDYPQQPHYGAGYGAPANQYPPPPVYSNQYVQPNTGTAPEGQYMPQYEQNMAQNMNQYAYNGAVPGFNPPALQAAPTSLPIYQGWNQDSVPLPTYTAPQNPIQHNGYVAPPYNNNYSQPYPQNTHNTYQQVIQPQPTKQHNEVETGKGNFDDGYGGQSNIPVHYGPKPIQYALNDGNGFTDTAHRAVYARNQDSVPKSRNGKEKSTRETRNRRQQSGSYSPFEDRYSSSQNKTQTPSQVTKANNNNSEPPKKKQWEQWITHPPSSFPPAMDAQTPTPEVVKPREVTKPQQIVKSREVIKPREVAKPQEVFKAPIKISAPVKLPVELPIQAQIQPLVQPSAQYLEVAEEAPFKSVAEGRSKAQGAVLNLWPRDVRYPDYIEEGINKEVVDGIFRDLKLDREAKASNGASSSRNAPDSQSSTASSTILAKQRQLMDATPSMLSSPPSGEKLQENRSPDGSSGPVTNPLSNSLSAPPKPTQTAEKTEKDRVLHMKMEALRKSREERAQKAAATKNVVVKPTAAPVVSTANLVPSASSLLSKPVSTAKVAPVTLPVPTPQSIQKAPVSPPSFAPTASTSTIQVENTAISPAPQQPAPLSIPQRTPSIPGLFLGTAIQRKRPVAADFDTPTTATAYKRPFGQSRGGNTPVVIDVSEDEYESEDEDVEMDLDSGADQDSPLQLTHKLSEQQNSAFQRSPLYSILPTSKPLTPPAVLSGTSTPLAVRNPAMKGPQELAEKEKAIEAMRRKIAEAEAASKARKEAQDKANGSRTPRSSSSNENKGPDTGSMVSKVETSIQIQQAIAVAEDKVVSDQKRLAEAHATEVVEESDLKNQEAENKRLRRQNLATNLPRVDAEMEEKQRKLQQLREQMAQIEADVKKSLDDKQRMAEEMERLGQEAEDQLQAQKAKLNELTSEKISLENFDITQTKPNSPRQGSLPVSEDLPGSLSSQDPTGPRALATPAVSDDSATSKPLPIPVGLVNVAAVPTVPVVPAVHQSESPKASEHVSPVAANGDRISADQALEAALQEAARAEVESPGEEFDTEDFYTAEPNVPLPEEPTVPVDKARSPSYSPGLDLDEPSLEERESVEDEYEPPEAASPVNSPPYSPAAPQPIEAEENVDKEIDTPMDVDEEGEVSDTNSEMILGGLSPARETDTEPSLPQRNGSFPLLTQAPTAVHPDPVPHFEPYQSPLQQFHAFRFHPEFSEQVNGGLRSLTYSHKIDPLKQFCPWELGGTCNDAECPYQHFKDVKLLDDGILTSLGNPAEFTGEQRQQFCKGLKKVLTDLRARKVRDFDVIAKEIIAHRAQFLGDPLSILNIDVDSD